MNVLLAKVDKSLESGNINNLALSIQVKLDGFSFSIRNIDLNKVVALFSYEITGNKHPLTLLESIKEVFENNEVLQYDFKLFNLVHLNSISTLVPKAIFKEENLKDYLNFNQKLLENEFISYDEIDSLDIINVYSPFVELNNFFYDKFGEFIFKHHSTVLIENLLIKQSSIKEKKVYIFVHSDSLEIVVFNEKKLEFYNSFEFETKEDFAYYILFTMEQLNISLEEIKVELYGEIEAYSELYDLLYKYVRNLSFGDRDNSLNYSYLIEDIEAHKYLTLFKQ